MLWNYHACCPGPACASILRLRVASLVCSGQTCEQRPWPVVSNCANPHPGSPSSTSGMPGCLNSSKAGLDARYWCPDLQKTTTGMLTPGGAMRMKCRDFGVMIAPDTSSIHAGWLSGTLGGVLRDRVTSTCEYPPRSIGTAALVVGRITRYSPPGAWRVWWAGGASAHSTRSFLRRMKSCTTLPIVVQPCSTGSSCTVRDVHALKREQVREGGGRKERGRA